MSEIARVRCEVCGAEWDPRTRPLGTLGCPNGLDHPVVHGLKGRVAELERSLSESRAREEGLRGALVGLGYHAPGQCYHGMSRWAGDHCVFDCPALASVPADAQVRPVVPKPDGGCVRCRGTGLGKYDVDEGAGSDTCPDCKGTGRAAQPKEKP